MLRLITTNYDDELRGALDAAGQYFQVVQNRKDDLALLRDSASHLVVKIHSDLDHPDDLILTSRDYDRIVSDPLGAYFRDKMRQVFEMFDVVVFGHSMSDPDLRLVLSTAKHTASPIHPVYMVLGNATVGQSREYRERFNIRIIPYKESDASHTQFRRMMVVADRFICPRDASLPAGLIPSEDEVQAATSLFIFRRLQAVVAEEPLDELIAPILLGVFSSASVCLTFSELLTTPSLAPFASKESFASAVRDCLSRLVQRKLVSTQHDKFAITRPGKDAVDAVGRQRRLEEEQALGQFVLDFIKRVPAATPQQCEIAKRSLRDALVASFRERGLTMANVIVADQSIASNELHDVFRELSRQAARFKDFESRASFIEVAHGFLVQPNEPQRKYLASISQGFFLYHMAGLDPTCARVRRDLFESTCWFLDSSVLLPLLALGCHNHVYARDLFIRLRGVNATLFSTVMLLREAWRHLEWAIAFIKRWSVHSPEFMAAAMRQAGYKQNLFLDGYVRLAAEGAVGTFEQYLGKAFPGGINQELVAARCKELGVCFLAASELPGFSQDDWGEIEWSKSEIAKERKRRGTYRGEYQVAAEAEVLEIIRKVRAGQYSLPGSIDLPHRVYFVSQSRALDLASTESLVVTWTPEAVYRYVSSLGGADLDPDLLQQCMLHEYYYAGVTFIDKPRYLKFFGTGVSEAKLHYQEQRDHYLKETEQARLQCAYDECFDDTPDLEKPFFVAQMGWELARKAEQKAEQTSRRAEHRAEEAEERARAAEARVGTAEAEAEAARKARLRAEHEANRLRNLRNLKQLRKREKQAKKRARKKRK